MKCEEFEQYIPNYVTGNIDPAIKEQMEAHYFECDTCFDALELIDAAASEIAESGVDKIREMETDEGTVEWLIAEAQKCLDRRDIDGAKLHYTKAQEIKPDDERLKRMIEGLRYDELIDEFGVAPKPEDPGRDVEIPEAHVIFAMLGDAQNALNAGDLALANGIYADAQDLAFKIPGVESALLSLQAQQTPIKHDQTEIIEGKEVKTHSDVNKARIAQRDIDLLKRALTDVEGNK